MKKFIPLFIFLFFVVLINSCSKDTLPITPPNTLKCKPTTEYTSLVGNQATFSYSYDINGKINLIKRLTGNQNQTLVDSTIIGKNTVVSYNYRSSESDLIIRTTVYKGGNLDGMPSEALVAIKEGTVALTDYHYFFFYDNKKRLNKVEYHTDHLLGDYEYDLSIVYDGNDNVMELEYKVTSGLNTNTITTIVAMGYDDKQNPYGGIKNWYFLMHAAWDNSDPGPLFTALSKNNPLGYTLLNGFKRTITHSYNDDSFPLIRTNTNTNDNGTYTFVET